MIIWEITYYRRTISGWEFGENRFFINKIEAEKILKFHGFKLMIDEENLYNNIGNSTRATLIEREVE